MPAHEPAEPFVVGATHRSSTIALRDRLFIDDAAAPDLFKRLADAGVGQAIVLSTCDRVEVQGMSGTPLEAIDTVLGIFADRAGEEIAAIAGEIDSLTGNPAVRRIFGVAASLESQVVGEPQVLGQVKAGHRLAARYGMVGPELETLLQAAYMVAKRVRTETPIAERSVTLASGAVQIARDVHGDLSGVNGLILGLGDMGDLIGGQLRLAGLARTVLTGPSRRSEAEARRTGCNFTPFEALDDALVEADIIVTASGAGRYLVTAEAMERALKRRRHRPVLVIDGGVPGDVDPAVHELDDAFVYTLDDLELVARENRAGREAAAEDAWRIVDAAVAAWRRSRAERDAVPTLVALRHRFEAIRDEVLAADPGADADEATRRLVNRLLHAPSKALREVAGDAGKGVEDTARVVAHLFGLAGEDSGEDEIENENENGIDED
ncbi:MAG: glutamyl-tRNA reductase [Alphaproteobacteria bacterium]|nr:glutamyl-tRNA reductase [Alphaproteobacteria bacterium]